MFEKFENLKPGKQVLFTVLIASAVISFWRGIWGLQDVYLFPDNMEVSLWSSVLLGLAILVTTHYTIKLYW